MSTPRAGRQRAGEGWLGRNPSPRIRETCRRVFTTVTARWTNACHLTPRCCAGRTTEPRPSTAGIREGGFRGALGAKKRQEGATRPPEAVRLAEAADVWFVPRGARRVGEKQTGITPRLGAGKAAVSPAASRAKGRREGGAHRLRTVLVGP